MLKDYEGLEEYEKLALFIKKTTGEDTITLRYIKSGLPPKSTQHFIKDYTYSNMLNEGLTYGTYFHCNNGSREYENRQSNYYLNAESITNINNLYVDLDSHDLKTMAVNDDEYKRIKAELKEKIELAIDNHDIKPSRIVETRHGFQAYYRVVDYDISNKGRFPSIIELIGYAYDLDSVDESVSDVNNLLRVPFVPFPDKHSDFTSNICYETDNEYTMQEILDWIGVDDINSLQDEVIPKSSVQYSAKDGDNGNYYVKFIGETLREVSARTESGTLLCGCPLCMEQCKDPDQDNLHLNLSTMVGGCWSCHEGGNSSRGCKVFNSPEQYKDSVDKYKNKHFPDINWGTLITAKPDGVNSNKTINNLKLKVMDCREFPIEVFPKKLHPFIRQSGLRSQTRIDYTAMALVIGFSTVFGNKYKIQALGFLNNSREWSVGAGAPSSGKTLGMEDGIDTPFKEIEKEYYDIWQTDIAEWNIEKIEYDCDMKEWKKDRSNDMPTLRSKPILRELCFDEGTIEAVRSTVNDNYKGIVCSPKEFFPWMLSCAKYSANSTGVGDLLTWQQFWDYDIDEPIKVKRVSKGGEVRRHCMTFYSTVQDDSILADTIFQKTLLRIGFTFRFLLFYPKKIENPPDHDTGIDDKHRDALKNKYKEIIERKVEGSYTFDHKIIVMCENNWGDNSAWGNFKEYIKTLNTYSNNEKNGSLFCSFIGRMAHHAFKLLLLIHLINQSYDGSDIETVSPETVDKTISLVNYFINHWLKLYEIYVRESVDKSSYGVKIKQNDIKDAIIRWFGSKNDRNYCRPSDATNMKWVKDKDEAIKMFQSLEAEGFGTLNNKRFKLT